ncbi:prepilin-type N-terminal cleavage/methylation domain-containing protein [Candidatus Saccharibacteria bacterium]|nr:prepilin-type N-terminal cleavage/methylation domain-containing protein [Candidatus Saccharibacteria bacterium]
MKKGFTLVELSLALALIGVLSIIVVLMISNAVSAYHRGLTLNQINTVGMAIVDDMRAAVQSSPGRFNYESDCQSVYDGVGGNALEQCKTDKAASFTFIERYGNVSFTGSSESFRVPLYGAFCTGKYSYIWNSGYFFNTEDYAIDSSLKDKMATFSYRSLTDSSRKVQTKTGFKLLKVEDDNRAVCKAAAGGASGSYLKNNDARNTLNNNAFDIACNSITDESKRPVDICGAIDASTIDTDIIDMNSGYGGLALYDLTAAKPASSQGTNNMFYAVSFILGTVRGGVNVSASGNYCATPEGYNASVENFDYCAINKFNFAAQATGG